MKKKSIIIISAAAGIILLLALMLLTNNIVLKNKSKLEIIDATFNCVKEPESFYEDKKYVYSFPCVQSSSVYVKFENGNKMLVVDALEENKVTIEELIRAGLKVYKSEK